MRKSDGGKRMDIPVLLMLLCFLLVPIGCAGVKCIGEMLQERERVESLRQEKGYIAKHSYYHAYGEYRVFYMVNESMVENVLYDTVTDDYIADLHAVAGDNGYGQYEIELYLLIPTKEVPYGWIVENAGSDFDDAALYRMAAYRITIPIEAETMDACMVKELTR